MKIKRLRTARSSASTSASLSSSFCTAGFRLTAGVGVLILCLIVLLVLVDVSLMSEYVRMPLGFEHASSLSSSHAADIRSRINATSFHQPSNYYRLVHLINQLNESELHRAADLINKALGAAGIVRAANDGQRSSSSSSNSNSDKDFITLRHSVTNDTRGDIRIPPVISEPYFCPLATQPQSSSFYRLRSSIGWSAEAQGVLHQAHRVGRGAQWFCDKVHASVKPWYAQAPRYKAEDVVIGVVTGENIKYSRAAAVRDTWMMRFPNSYLYMMESDPELPAVGVYNEETRYIFDHYRVQHEPVRANQWVHMFAIKDMVERHPNAKWYYLGGCDNYLHADHFLHLLDNVSSDGLVWISPNHWGPTYLPPKWDLSEWPEYARDDPQLRNLTNPRLGLKNTNTFNFVTGAFSWFLSNSMAKAYVKDLHRFLRALMKADFSGWNPRWGNVAACGCHDLWFGMYMTLLGYKLEDGPGWRHLTHPYSVEAQPEAVVNNYAIYHYVSPYHQYALDQRIVHEKVDRMINAGDFVSLTNFFREFVDEHYEVLRRRQAEAATLARNSPNLKPRLYDIVTPLRKNMTRMGNVKDWYGVALEDYVLLTTATATTSTTTTTTTDDAEHAIDEERLRNSTRSDVF